jgi:uncharacterized protein YbaR (Trm112 family)
MPQETRNQSAVRAMLRNPNTGSDLVEEDGDMVDPETSERFPIQDGIPVVLHDEDVVGQSVRTPRSLQTGTIDRSSSATPPPTAVELT